MSLNKEVIAFLNENLTHNPLLNELNLQFMQITDLLPYMELLGQFKHLQKISLHGNRIKQLPIDLSRLAHLQQIDLSNNLIKDINLAIISLKTLPSLKRLNLPVKKEKQAEISEQLRGLTHLNNGKISRTPILKQKNTNNPMQHVIKTLKQQFYRLIDIQNRYFEGTGRTDNQEYFSQNLQQLLSQAQTRLERATSQQQAESINNYTIYQMYNLVKKPAIELSIEMCEDLGKFISDISTYQDSLTENMTLSSISIPQEKVSTHNDKQLETRVLQYEKEIKRLRKQKDQLISEVNHLQSENKKYIDSLVRLSKGNQIANLSLKTQNVSVSEKFRSTSTVQHPASNFHSTGRTLTLKQVKQTIEQIYQSKLKFDQKNHDGKLPRQTMHQYLFTYLNQKYGLKSLTIQAANSIVSAIQSYSAEDNDVAVFGKMLRNQIDEEFRNVQSELKATIYNLLKMHIKSQYPFKSAIQINELYNEKVSHDITMDQCDDIVKYLYNKNDAQRILQMIDIVLKLSNPSEEQQPRRSQMTRKDQSKKKTIKFSLFLQTVLDFQLKNHEKLLKPLIKAFRGRDSDADGIIDEDQFIAVIEELCNQASEIIPEFLTIVDPYETKCITFTQVVRLVANYPEGNPILMRFLQKQPQES